MNPKTYQNFVPFRHLRLGQHLAERALAKVAGISRLTLRSVEAGNDSLSLRSCALVAHALHHELALVSWPQEIGHSEYSSVAVSFKTQRAGFASWKIHFFELVDEFRRSLDPRLLLLPPPADFDRRLRALLASIVLELSREVEISAPSWAAQPWFLDRPWFVAEIENLKAMAVLESPLAFRQNNIFVLDNFLQRA